MAPMAAALGAVLAALLLCGAARADFASDRAECADKLVPMATCLTYVEDQGAAPTPDCCAGLAQVLQGSKKCICVLVKDRDDPNLGFKVNVTKAMRLPSLCKDQASFADCPSMCLSENTSGQTRIAHQPDKVKTVGIIIGTSEKNRVVEFTRQLTRPLKFHNTQELLNLAPNSKDAQIFEQYEKQYGGQSSSPGASTGSSSGKGAGAASASTGAQKSGVGAGRRWLGVEIVGGAACSSFCLASLFVSYFALGHY